MWIGNACKDGLCLPRPRALSKARACTLWTQTQPRVDRRLLTFSQAVRVIAHTHDSKENSDEYGLPSSHVANCLAFFAYLLMHTGSGLHTHAGAWALLAAWTALVALGRLYLGARADAQLGLLRWC